MLFNSLIFVFGFLPVAVAGYWALAASRLTRLRLLWIIAVSLVFYGYWTPEYTLLLLISVAANYGFGRVIARESLDRRLRSAAMALGIVLNLGALGYFKYANFFVENLNLALGTDVFLAKIALPLAISFYTFQQISFLIDLRRSQITLGGPVGYMAYVIFFPQLIAGPIVHFQELAPQLLARPRLDRALGNIVIGLTIFGIGLAKKTIFADTAALVASPVFDAAAVGTPPGLLAAWAAAFAYTLQVYFDFAGYSDMAIGLARMFGIKLPLNFHLPLRASSINELWRRWHMTLSRFVLSYVFQPISIAMGRRAAMRDYGRWRSLVVGTLAPIFLAMLLIGIWHGAGWTFVLFGAMHGTYVALNELWRALARKRRGVSVLPDWAIAAMTPRRAQALTLLAFVVAAVPFRADGIGAVGHIFAGMLGLNGIGEVPADWAAGVAGAMAIIVIGYLIVYLMPATQQIMANHEPALDWEKWHDVAPTALRIRWSPRPGPAIAGGVVIMLAIAFILRGSTEFIYFNF